MWESLLLKFPANPQGWGNSAISRSTFNHLTQQGHSSRAGATQQEGPHWVPKTCTQNSGKHVFSSGRLSACVLGSTSLFPCLIQPHDITITKVHYLLSALTAIIRNDSPFLPFCLISSSNPAASFSSVLEDGSVSPPQQRNALLQPQPFHSPHSVLNLPMSDSPFVYLLNTVSRFPFSYLELLVSQGAPPALSRVPMGTQ